MPNFNQAFEPVPTDLGTQAQRQQILQLVREIESLEMTGEKENALKARSIRRQALEFQDPLEDALSIYSERASDALSELSPRTVRNFAHVMTAGHVLDVVSNLRDQGWRREVWIVGAAGCGTTIGGKPLRAFMKATLDYRMTQLLQEILVPTEEASGLDHEHVVPIRGRFYWVSQSVAHALSAEAGLNHPNPADIEALMQYAHWAYNGAAWSSGRLGELPLRARSAELAQDLSVDLGQYAGTPFPELIRSRKSETHPFVVCDDDFVPCRGDIIQLRMEAPLLGALRRSIGQRRAAVAFERATRSILAEIPGLSVMDGPAFVRVSDQDPGELDIFALGADGSALLGEVKSHVVREGEPTTRESYDSGIVKLSEQLGRRSSAFREGSPVTADGQTVATSTNKSHHATLGVTLHEYSGAAWRAMDWHPHQAPVDVPVMPIHDLQMVASAMLDDDDLFNYLSIRKELFSRGSAVANDELDILSWYLRFGPRICHSQLQKAQGRFIIMSGKDIPVPEQMRGSPSSRNDWRQRLLQLPHVN